MDAAYVRDVIAPPFFDNFWTRKTAFSKLLSRQLIETTVEIATKIGGAEIISKRVHDLKDDNEPFRKMVMETIEKIVIMLGVNDIDQELEDSLVEGVIYAFH